MARDAKHLPVNITIYRWAGQKLFWRITSECVVCHVVIQQVQGLLAAHPDWPVELEIKPWLTHLWETLWRGAWRTPAVIVDSRVVSQAVVPPFALLEDAVREALAKRGFRADSAPASASWDPMKVIEHTHFL